MSNQDWIEHIERAIREATPLAFADNDAMKDVSEKIQQFHNETGRWPEELMVIGQFAVPHEQRLIRAAQDADIAASKKQRLDYLSGPTREEAVAELRKLRKPENRRAFIPEDLSHLSRDEFDKLSDAEIKRRLSGQESLDLNREGSKLNLHNPQNERDRYEREKILRYRGSDPIRRALKRELLDGSEQRDVQARRDALEQSVAERRAAIAALKAGKK